MSWQSALSDGKLQSSAHAYDYGLLLFLRVYRSFLYLFVVSFLYELGVHAPVEMEALFDRVPLFET